MQGLRCLYCSLTVWKLDWVVLGLCNVLFLDVFRVTRAVNVMASGRIIMVNQKARMDA